MNRRPRTQSDRSGGNPLLVALVTLCWLIITVFIYDSGTIAGATTSTSTSTTIKKNWVTFFSGKTPPKTKIALLQNGTKFAQVIDSQASSPLAKEALASVSRVVLTSSTSAKVTYTISLAGQPALKNQVGTSVRVGGVWKVGTSSFCALLALEKVKAAACS